MDARFVYDIPYVKEVLGYLFIPFLIFVIISCAFLVGFALSFKKQVDAANIKSFVVYVVLASPLLPFFSFLALLFKMIKLIKHRPSKKENLVPVSKDASIVVEPVAEDTISITEIPAMPVTEIDEVLEDDDFLSEDIETL